MMKISAVLLNQTLALFVIRWKILPFALEHLPALLVPFVNYLELLEDSSVYVALDWQRFGDMCAVSFSAACERERCLVQFNNCITRPSSDNRLGA